MKKVILLISSLVLFGVQAQATEINADNLKTLLESKSARLNAASLEVEAAKAYEGSLGRSFRRSDVRCTFARAKSCSSSMAFI